MSKSQFNAFDKVLVRDCDDQTWKPDIFVIEMPSETNRYKTLTNSWNQCIPYKGNEHLAFTNKPAKFQHKKKEILEFKRGEVVIISKGKGDDEISGVFLELDRKENICHCAVKTRLCWYIISTEISSLHKRTSS